MPTELDTASRRWVEHLRLGHPRRDQAVGDLHAVLQRVAVSELSRRRHELGSISGPEFDALAQQAAGDALVSVLDKLDQFRGDSRFTTWAYKFVIFEVSDKVARHASHRRPPAGGLARDRRLDALSQGIGELTARQREVFVSIALDEVPIDVVAVKLGTDRNAVYMNLFDARRRLQALMTAPLRTRDATELPGT